MASGDGPDPRPLPGLAGTAALALSPDGGRALAVRGNLLSLLELAAGAVSEVPFPQPNFYDYQARGEPDARWKPHVRFGERARDNGPAGNADTAPRPDSSTHQLRRRGCCRRGA